MARNKKFPTRRSAPSRSRRQRPVGGDVGQSSISSFDEILNTAARHLSGGTEEEILTALKPAQGLLPEASLSQRRKYHRLLALGQAHANRLLDAEQTCLTALADEPNVPDYYFVLTYVALSLREFDKARQWAEAYLKTQPTSGAGDRSMGFCVSVSHRSQVINLLGSAHMEQGRLESAAECFRDAIGADPGNHLPYLNLANTYLRLHRRNDAIKVIQKGLSSCRQIGDLRLMNESYKKTATISACLMVKNEEELLPGCLDSIRDWVDEIIVVDTGSTDKTIEIAESYGAKIFHQPWEGNFSKHRNHTIELATCDWIFIIDADERFEPDHVDSLLKAVNSGDHEIISVNVYNLYGSVNHKLTAVNSMRFFKRNMNLRYEGIVHNSLRIPDGARISRAPFVMQHLGYDLSPEKMQAKFDRSHALLLKQVEENPDYAYAWFNLAQLYRGRVAEDVELWGPKIIQAAKRVIELVTPDDPNRSHFFVMAHDQIAWTEYLLGNSSEAEKWAHKALEYKPDYLDPLMLIAHAHARQGRHEQALKAYRVYLDAQAKYDEFEEIDAFILYHPESQATAYFGMGCVAELLGRKDEAETYYLKAIEHSPGYLHANLHLGRVYLEKDDLIGARKHFESQNDHDQPHPQATLGLACVSVKSGRIDEAGQLFEKALELDSKDFDILTKSAQFFAQVGQESRACELYEKALDLHPTIPGV
ncbi:MAG: tetratricopeptide repeat protein, partial [bacterium]